MQLKGNELAEEIEETAKEMGKTPEQIKGFLRNIKYGKYNRYLDKSNKRLEEGAEQILMKKSLDEPHEKLEKKPFTLFVDDEVLTLSVALNCNILKTVRNYEKEYLKKMHMDDSAQIYRTEKISKENVSKDVYEEMISNSTTNKKKRKRRCGACERCLTPKCKNCNNCKNPRLKKACIRRQCLDPNEPTGAVEPVQNWVRKTLMSP